METLPFETPIIFSNNGLYNQASSQSIPPHSIEEILFRDLLVNNENNKYEIPYLYKVRKSQTEYRRLGLLHPASQWRIMNFYKKYEHLMLYYCSHSPASIRSPYRIAGSFFYKSHDYDIYKYRTGVVSMSKLENITKHSPSFFSYRGYDRLHKFFKSIDYMNLEKKYLFMRSIDVSKCFDSIYTHSMSWALRGKEFSKNYKHISTVFAHEFDRLMSCANHGETNGIVIGPEVSRIFAEIILQCIDVNVIGLLQKEKLKFDIDYCFRRYVDNIYIFSKTEQDCNKIQRCYSDVLMSFNLHVNTAKTINLTRPFVTIKSRLVEEAINITKSFIDKFLKNDKKQNKIIPKKIYSPSALAISYIESIKTICSHNDVGYDDVSGYLIAVFTERVKKLILINVVNDDMEQKNYRDSIFVMLDILYFLYHVSPSVSASYRLSMSVILIIRFVSKNLKMYEDTVKQRIFELTVFLIDNITNNNDNQVEGFIPIEEINILLSVRELDNAPIRNYCFPEPILRRLFTEACKPSYFSIVSCLFYIGSESQYDGLREEMIEHAEKKLSELSDIKINCEQAHLLLDLINCPYIPDDNKKEWLRRAFNALKKTPKNNDIMFFLQSKTKASACVNWTGIDLLVAIEKKELTRVY
ncbi:MAG: RNA-directed DNA polymerase [Magnetococcus sp. XQGC-1]